MLLFSILGIAACSEHAVVEKIPADSNTASGKKEIRFITLAFISEWKIKQALV
jgi:hypothetical protein